MVDANEISKSDVPDVPDPPEELGPAGREQWTWLWEHGGDDLADVLPLAVELCRTADRLFSIRGDITRRGITLSNGRKNPSLAEEARFQRQYVLTWRSLGLADKDPAAAGRVGRPPGQKKTGWF